jgi:A/G-specific adenine glycosylase
LANASSTPDPADLLAWYDRHRRDLPWRARPGEAADPYRVWLSEIMLQQTTVRAVIPYYANFLARFPTIAALATASLDEVLAAWAGLGYYSRARAMHACAVAVIERHGGRLPASEAELAALPGIGPYTAAAIAAIAFDWPAVPVDGNVERVVTRLFRLEAELPVAKPLVRQLAKGLSPPARHGDFAQALMDLGATICTPKRPLCALCPWREPCRARAAGDQESFPRKAAKREGELRRGAAFVVERADGAVLARTRPAEGLLGGMTEVPGSEWSPSFDEAAALASAPLLPDGGHLEWRRLPGHVRHVFTHFPLELAVFAATAPRDADAPSGHRWIAGNAIASAAFPTVMRKALAHAGIGGHPRPLKPPRRAPA